MENLIKVLPESVANQIAAGEVVQRPASVVKELLENAIDAGADKITLNIKDSGKALIEVIDNGKGMSEIDARLCIERHATSKISEINDIFHIRTMGFRGEALASITAVSQTEIKSMSEEDETATLLKLNGNEVTAQSQVAGSRGTVISVKNLFFNVPARRNFLKSNNVESRHINEVFQQVALSSPEIAFSYFNNGEEIYHLSKSNFKQRIIELFGKRFKERLIPIEEETEIVRVSGFVGKPEFATAKRGEQYFLVNGRYIKSPYLHHAVMAAYEDLLARDSQPQYFLRFEIDPEQIDINIHPTKTEIKFLEERSIYAILRTTIRQSLGKFNIAPSLDFERETAFDNVVFDKNKSVKMPEVKVDKDFNPFNTSPSMSSFSKKDSREMMEKSLQMMDVEVAGQKSAPTTDEEKRILSMDEIPADNQRFIQLHNRFILTHLKSGFMIVDQHRAHQRVLYDDFTRNSEKSAVTQQLLFPVLIEMSAKEYELVKEVQSDLEKVGYSIEEFGKDSISINGVPPGIQEKDIKEIFLKMMGDYKEFGEKDVNKRMNSIAFSLARNMSIKAGQKLQEKEMESLIDQLFACEMPYALPNSKPIVITIPLDELEKKFQYRS